MTEQVIETIPLANNLMLTIYDASKRIAGDRWQVTLVARMIIPVTESVPETNPAVPPATELRRALGDTVTYEIKKQRNFISEPEKPVVFSQLMEMFRTYSVPYLAHPNFPARFILKKYHEHLKHRPR